MCRIYTRWPERHVSPCLSDDVLLHQCSAGHQSSKGPVEEAKEGVIIVQWIKPHTSSKLAFISVSATCVNSVNFGVGNTTHIHITSFLYWHPESSNCDKQKENWAKTDAWEVVSL